ncbi:Carboxypeptidase S [Venturia nashicola]|uniref:Carboxypeptidase S n=1 Tax=Venturia nashicola TaxID=86259 RepID=A0A4Z1P2B1_9PEZI|nr:Carboxypeptidase S [Venturia nashicola]
MVPGFVADHLLGHTNSSTTTAPSSSRACSGCTVTASEKYLTYPSTVEVDTATIEQTIVPLVTVYADGSSETNYKTVTAKANVTGIYQPPTPTDPYAHLTWEHDGVILTYPTTYVQFFGLRGGLLTPVITTAATSCAVKDELLQVGTLDPAGLIVEVLATAKVDPAHPTAISAPPAILSFLNGIPAVSSQFSGTDVKDCSWTKILTTRITAGFTNAPNTALSSAVATNQKVTVSILTQVTAKQQVITVSSNKGTDQANRDSPTPRPEPPAINTEHKATSAVAVNPTPNTAAPQSHQQPTNSPDVVSIIAGILAGGTPGAQTIDNGGNPTQGAASGTLAGSKADQGRTITVAGSKAASGIGFTSAPAVATGGAYHSRSDMHLWCLGLMFGTVGVFLFG